MTLSYGRCGGRVEYGISYRDLEEMLCERGVDGKNVFEGEKHDPEI